MWPMHLWSLEWLCPMVKEEMHLQENTLNDLDLVVVKETQNVVQYLPNHMTYAPAKFEVASFNSLGEDGFTRKYTIWPWFWGQGHTKCSPVPSTSCDLCTCKLWSWYVQWYGRRCIYKKINFLTLTPRSRSHEKLPSTLDIMRPMQRQNLKLLLPKVYEEMRLQENTLFGIWPWPWGQGHTKLHPVHWHHGTLQPKFEVATSKSLWGDGFTKNIHSLTLTLGSRSHETSPSTVYIMWSLHLQSLKLLRPTV